MRKLSIVAAAVIFVFAVSSTYGYTHPLTGTIVRQVTNPWEKNIGFGLANDGVNLYVTGTADGNIRVVDVATLSVVDTIPTPASMICGLDFHDGILFAADPFPDFNVSAASRIYAIEASSGTTLYSFDAPDNTVMGLSMGPDGLLYAMDDYDGVQESGAFIYAFNPIDGNLVNTIDTDENLYGTDIIEWEGNLFLTNDNFPPSGLSFYELEDGTIDQSYCLSVSGIPHQNFRGSTLMGDSLYLWSQYGSDTLLTEIELSPVPEPATILLLGLGAVMLRRRRLKVS